MCRYKFHKRQLLLIHVRVNAPAFPGKAGAVTKNDTFCFSFTARCPCPPGIIKNRVGSERLFARFTALPGTLPQVYF